MRAACSKWVEGRRLPDYQPSPLGTQAESPGGCRNADHDKRAGDSRLSAGPQRAGLRPATKKLAAQSLLRSVGKPLRLQPTWLWARLPTRTLAAWFSGPRGLSHYPSAPLLNARLTDRGWRLPLR